MKIKETQLRQIIREEIQKLNEDSGYKNQPEDFKKKVRSIKKELNKSYPVKSLDYKFNTTTDMNEFHFTLKDSINIDDKKKLKNWFKKIMKHYWSTEEVGFNIKGNTLIISKAK